jgi:hypothetical protein
MIGPSAHTDMANAHKARLARIAGRAFRPAPVIVPEVIALEPVEPEPVPADAVHVPWFPDPDFLGRRVSLERIKAAVSQAYGVTVLDLVSARRTANVIAPRQVAMYLAKVMTPNSLPAIGRAFGDRDHTTVFHAVKKIALHTAIDQEFAARVEAIKESIGA